MTERDRSIPVQVPGFHASEPVEETPESQRDGTSLWQREALGRALDTHAEHTHDIGWGDGTRYRVRDAADQDTLLAVYPAVGVVQITSHDAQITLYRQPPPSLYTDRVRFEQLGLNGGLDLTLTRRGQLRLDIRPIVPDVPVPEPTALPEGHALAGMSQARSSVMPATAFTQPSETGPMTADDDPAGMDVPTEPVTAVIRHPGRADDPGDVPSRRPVIAADGPTDRGADSATASDADTQRPRLTVAGRLGREPSFRTTRTGTLVASFPLAVRDDAGETTWHTVLAFGARAERLREGLSKGQQVEVIGYLHQRERTTRTGEPRTIEEIYATVVRPVT